MRDKILDRKTFRGQTKQKFMWKKTKNKINKKPWETVKCLFFYEIFLYFLSSRLFLFALKKKFKINKNEVMKIL